MSGAPAAAGAAGAAGARRGVAAADVAFDDAQPAVLKTDGGDNEASGNAIHRAPGRRCNGSDVMSETPFWQ